MPRVRFLQHVAGHAPGDEVDLPADEARAVADGSVAEFVRAEIPQTPERETARTEKAAPQRRTPRAKTAKPEAGDETSKESK